MDVLAAWGAVLAKLGSWAMVFVGFSLVILVHELGHFFAAKWAGVKVDKLAIGFGKELVGITRGETRYAINVLPLGGYVKMLGQEDFELDKSSEWEVSKDPRAFTSQSVGKRAVIVSAGVVMNLIAAALIFMIVFMAGMESMPAKVGFVLPDSPAQRGGVQVGDEIVRINDRKMDDFPDVMMAIALSDVDEPLTFDIKRGQETVALEIPSEYNERRGLPQIGIGPGMTREVNWVSPLLDDDETAIRRGDTILAVNGREVANYYDFRLAVMAAQSRQVDVLVDRPSDPNDPDSPVQQATCRVRSNLSFLYGRVKDDGMLDADSATLLGLIPRTAIGSVAPGKPASRAVVLGEGGDQAGPGFKTGDVILRWADMDSPRVTEIQASVLENESEVLRAVVLRNGQQMELAVTPRRPAWPPINSSPPVIGVTFDRPDVAHVTVADTLEGSPASSLGIPRGATITTVDSEPVATWYDLVQQFTDRAGETVVLAWDHQGVAGQGTLSLPQSLTKALGLLPTASIKSINSKSSIVGQMGERNVVFVLPSWQAIQALCRETLGDQEASEVEFTWIDRLDGTKSTRTIVVTSAMLDPWLQRVQYSLDDIEAGAERFILRAANPLAAVRIGIKRTVRLVQQTYVTIERIIFSRTVGVDKLSGPVGIVKMGAQAASVSIVKLLYFLGIISASLAVINFLPLPIVDGGLMVFLIIEKIKGSPVNLKLQFITQLVGLALIIFVFAFITLQDIVNWSG